MKSEHYSEEDKVGLMAIKQPLMRMYGFVKVWLHVFLTTIPDGCERPASNPGLYTPCHINV
jgi:hypothetical protein